MLRKRHLTVHYYSQVIDRVNKIKDDTTQHVQKFNRMTQPWKRDRAFTDVQLQRIGLAPLSQSIQIVLNPQAISETTHRKEQFHVVSITKNPHVPKNLRDLIQKPNEPEWAQMAALWNTRSDQNIPRNTVTHPHPLDSTRKVRTQLTAGGLNISWHFIQEQPMTHLIKGLRKVRVDWIHLTPILNWLQNKRRVFQQIRDSWPALNKAVLTSHQKFTQFMHILSTLLKFILSLLIKGLSILVMDFYFRLSNNVVRAEPFFFQWLAWIL
jgi:hypothetical protein